MTKNLFVPLTTQAYEWFSMGKEFELRKSERCWNRKQIYSDRGVTLSKGYGKRDRKKGRVGKVIFSSLDLILSRVPFRKIIPIAKNRKEAKEIVRNILGEAKEYVAFEVILNDRH